MARFCTLIIPLLLLAGTVSVAGYPGQQGGTDRDTEEGELSSLVPDVDTEPRSLTVRDPCLDGSYNVINDSLRSSSKYERLNFHKLCDLTMKSGWYRFLLDGENAVIPTCCVNIYHCGTDAPAWVDLQNNALPAEFREVSARACAHWGEDCCRWETPIIVRNCGDFLLYKMRGIGHCEVAFCAEPQA
ncbi:pancreatic secretory granule membrane major glycoprotein GP2-like [Babylonia areolata]|uniref:pancreatic secretory granule membrane major glycoprotein GP2-like n=1 Tax=Babylonia areolata TaxID=304850 RepID=UPI003FD269DE